MKKKMYLVKMEVMASNISQAVRPVNRVKGKVYEVIECEKQPELEKKIGFNSNNKK